ncbi:DUF58 domain-containing protein [Homoserinimonas sp. OAct 916]|uniref:DUF58 domain-containing protein n=1 Tax=Homoserinimonas sp. OAct 916 TaxID=2211450 RepID=UPI000DBE6844|nr:DUF58 domain-containing protein [Homoserinimonas sp. OAct 916]
MKADTRSRLTRAQVETSTVSHTRYTEAASGSLVSVVVWWVRVWRAVRRSVAAATRWVRETVTPAGWVVVFAVAVLLPVGLYFGWVELVIAGAIGALLLLIALPFLAGGRSYSIDFSLPVDRVVAGGEVVGTLRVTNTSHRLELPGRVDVPIGRGLLEVHVPLLRAGHVHDERVAVPAYRRGVLDVGPVTWVRTDPIGVLKREVAWAGIHRLFIHPVTVSIPSTSAGFVRDLEGSATSDLVDSDISFHAIREYAHGDSRRNIHWKSTAKTGTLMVRQFEETRRSRLAIVLSVNEHEYASDDEFEMAVSAAGSLGVRAIRDGRDVAVVASEEIPELVRGRVRSVRSLSVLSTRSLLDELSGVERSENTMPTEDVSMLASQVVPDISIAFIVCGSTMTPARLQSIALKFPINVQTVAVLCDPNSAPSYRELAGTGVLTIGVLDDFRSLLARRAG